MAGISTSVNASCPQERSIYFWEVLFLLWRCRVFPGIGESKLKSAEWKLYVNIKLCEKHFNILHILGLNTRESEYIYDRILKCLCHGWEEISHCS